MRLSLATSCAFAACVLAVPMASHAQQSSGIQTVHNFQGQNLDGAGPVGGLTKVGNALYGVTYLGGDKLSGTIFKITAAGVYSMLYQFQGGTSDGAGPGAQMIAVGTTLYGTTAYGGQYDDGTIFSFNTATGGYSSVYEFYGTHKSVVNGSGNNPDGSRPVARLFYANSLLYGTTLAGGSNKCFDKRGCGTVFSYDVNQEGFAHRDNILYDFQGTAQPGSGAPSDGSAPRAGLTLLGSVLYGTTSAGGGDGCLDGLGCGTIYSLDMSASPPAYSLIYGFKGGANDGALPLSELSVGGPSLLYGNTKKGGGLGCGGMGCGLVFSLSTARLPPPPGAAASFGGGTNTGSGNPPMMLSCFGAGTGAGPIGPLNVHHGNSTGPGAVPFNVHHGYAEGTTVGGGSGSGQSGGSGGICGPANPPPADGLASANPRQRAFGTAYQVDLVTGEQTILFNFTQAADTGNCSQATCPGAKPTGELVEAGGYLYGETYSGGLGDSGTLFRLPPPPPP